MNITALVLLHPDFEELEAVAPIDLLARAGIDVTTASTADDQTVTGRSGIQIKANQLLSEITACQLFDVLVLPGGPGINALRNNRVICSAIRRQKKASKYIACICAAPLLLKDAGILNSETKYTAFPATAQELPEAIDAPVVIDGELITSRGAGTATEFGLSIVAALVGPDKTKEIADSICWPH